MSCLKLFSYIVVNFFPLLNNRYLPLLEDSLHLLMDEMCYSASFILLRFIASIEIAS